MDVGPRRFHEWTGRAEHGRHHHDELADTSERARGGDGFDGNRRSHSERLGVREQCRSLQELVVIGSAGRPPSEHQEIGPQSFCDVPRNLVSAFEFSFACREDRAELSARSRTEVGMSCRQHGVRIPNGIRPTDVSRPARYLIRLPFEGLARITVSPPHVRWAVEGIRWLSVPRSTERFDTQLVDVA